MTILVRLWPLAAVVGIVLLVLGRPGSCQQTSPLQGRGFPPDQGLDVYVSLLIDRILSVDDVNYRFEAMLYFQLSWLDPRAQPAIENATAAAASDPGYNNGAGCEFPCTSLYQWTPGAPCCDGLFLPTLEFVNARGFSQDRPLRWRVAVNEEPGNEAVVWWSYVLGEFYTPMKFHAFPFDEQKLLIQMQYGNRNTSSPIRFTPSSTAPELFHPRTGDDLDGWNIKAVEVIPYNFSAHAAAVIRNSGASTSAPGDPWPINPANKSVTPFTSQLWTEGVNVVITVGRISDYYIIVAILPIAVNVWLCLLVFFISPRHLDTRLGVVVTMFLSLTAIQFVISGVLPSSSTVVPTQQLVIVSYAVLAIIGIMSIVVYFIITADRQRAKRERSRRASRAFTQRWTTFVGGVGSASAAGVDAAAAAATAGAAVPVSPGLRQPGTPPAAGRLEQQGLMAGDSATASAAAAADVAGGPLGTAAATGGGALQGSRRGASGENGGAGGADKDHVRFAGLGMCGATPDDDKGDSDESDDGAGDNKSYAGTDSEADSEPPFREGRADGKRGVRWEDDPEAPAESPLTNNHLVTAGGGFQGDGKDGSTCVLTPDRGEGPYLDLEAGVTRVPPPPLLHEQQEQQPRRSISLEVDGSRRRRARACFACCSVPWWRAVLLAPWRWLTTQQLKLKEMMREAEQNKEYAEHLARSLDRVVFWVVLLGYNVAIVIIFAIGAQDQPSYAFERPDD